MYPVSGIQNGLTGIESKSNEEFFESLPNEVVVMIFSLLKPQEIVENASLCKRLWDIGRASLTANAKNKWFLAAVKIGKI